MATSNAFLHGLSSPFLSGAKPFRALLAGGNPAAAAPRRLVVAAAAASKKSWIPAVKGGGNLVDPEWLDGSWSEGD